MGMLLIGQMQTSCLQLHSQSVPKTCQSVFNADISYILDFFSLDIFRFAKQITLIVEPISQWT